MPADDRPTVPNPPPQIDTWGEVWRHECEVRWLANRPNANTRRAYLDAIEQRRGRPAADRLRASLLALWQTRKRPDPHHG